MRDNHHHAATNDNSLGSFQICEVRHCVALLSTRGGGSRRPSPADVRCSELDELSISCLPRQTLLEPFPQPSIRVRS